MRKKNKQNYKNIIKKMFFEMENNRSQYVVETITNNEEYEFVCNIKKSDKIRFYPNYANVFNLCRMMSLSTYDYEGYEDLVKYVKVSEKQSSAQFRKRCFGIKPEIELEDPSAMITRFIYEVARKGEMEELRFLKRGDIFLNGQDGSKYLWNGNEIVKEEDVEDFMSLPEFPVGFWKHALSYVAPIRHAYDKYAEEIIRKEKIVAVDPCRFKIEKITDYIPSLRQKIDFCYEIFTRTEKTPDQVRKLLIEKFENESLAYQLIDDIPVDELHKPKDIEQLYCRIEIEE